MTYSVLLAAERKARILLLRESIHISSKHDDRTAIYEYAMQDELELAYCLSVHKSQGSEFNCVVMPVVGGPPMLLTRNLFYTALTRAKKLVVLVGREEAVADMVHNDHIARRYTALCQRMRELDEAGA